MKSSVSAINCYDNMISRSSELLSFINLTERSNVNITDAEVRKRGDQTGLDTPVVHAVNDEC